MPRFNYVALDTRGQEATGLVEAASTNDAIGRLRQAGYFPTSVYEEAVARADSKADRRRAAKMARATKPRAKTGIVLFQRTKIKPKILMIFTRQLATLIDSGLPLLRSLTVLAKQERDKVLKNTINKLSDSVQSGNTFSDALALHPKIFNDLFVNMVKAGEVGGVLELVLNRLSEFQEKAAKIKNKVVAAMVYPLIVITLAMAIMGFLLVFIVPKFEAIFHDMLGNKPLPAITRFVIAASNFVQHHGLLLVGAVIAAGAAYKFINRTRGGRGFKSQDSDLAVFAHTGNTGHERCSDFAGIKHYPRNRRQRRHRRSDLTGTRQRKGRRIDCSTAGSQPLFSADGNQHDRCGRRNR